MKTDWAERLKQSFNYLFLLSILSNLRDWEAIYTSLDLEQQCSLLADIQ